LKGGRGGGGYNLRASTLIDFIAIINGKESTYNRKMGRQLRWENFVASKV
jgi:hypothetical protein